MEYCVDYTKKPDERVFSSQQIESMQSFTSCLAIEITIKIMEEVQCIEILRGGSSKESKNVPRYSYKYRDEHYLSLVVIGTQNVRTFLQSTPFVRWSIATTPVYNSELIIGEFQKFIRRVFTYAVKHLYISYDIPMPPETTDLVVDLIVVEMLRQFKSHHYMFQSTGRAIAEARRNGCDY